MITYTYSATARNERGYICKADFGTEVAMMDWAAAVDHQGYELLTAVREVWEEVNGWVHLVCVETYKMGRPQ